MVGEHVIPLARNFNGIDLESGSSNSAVCTFSIHISSRGIHANCEPYFDVMVVLCLGEIEILTIFNIGDLFSLVISSKCISI